MTAEPSAVPEPPVESPATAPAAVSATRPLYWSIRRELWENRSIVIGPLAAAAVVLFGFTMHVLVRAHRTRAAASTLDPAQQYAALVVPYSVAATMIMVTAIVVGVFYCVDALHGERRDRSILFWKSLPVSDLTTVLSKASIPLVVLPLIAFAVSLATQVVMRVLSIAVPTLGGVSAGTLFEKWFVMFYGLSVHSLWHAPLYAWLLLVSVWARRTPLLWAVLPPLALGAFERIVFQTSYFAAFMKYRVAGAMTAAFDLEPKSGRIIHLEQLDPLGFLTSPGLWLGLAAAALFLAVAVRLRRYREPI